MERGTACRWIRYMGNEEMHVCPILMRTVKYRDEKCTENCGETECPVMGLHKDEGD